MDARVEGRRGGISNTSASSTDEERSKAGTSHPSRGDVCLTRKRVWSRVLPFEECAQVSRSVICSTEDSSWIGGDRSDLRSKKCPEVSCAATKTLYQQHQVTFISLHSAKSRRMRLRFASSYSVPADTRHYFQVKTRIPKPRASYAPPRQEPKPTQCHHAFSKAEQYVHRKYLNEKGGCKVEEFKKSSNSYRRRQLGIGKPSETGMIS